MMETQHNSDRDSIKLATKKNRNKQTDANKGPQLFPIEFFNLAIPTRIFAQSRNPKDLYFWYPASRTRPYFAFKSRMPALK